MSGGGGSLEIVIVSYRCRELLLACLESIAANPYTGGRRRSRSSTTRAPTAPSRRCASASPSVRAHRAATTTSASRSANNLALRASTADSVLLLNPDTEVWPGVLDAMAAFLDEHPRAGVAGCRLVRRDGSFDHASKRSIPTIADALHYFRPGGGRASGSGLSRAARRRGGVGAVDAVNGAFMLIRPEAMREVGLLDPGYWMYGEDLDWCARFRRAGWDVLYNGRVTTLHVKGATAGSHRRWRQNAAFHQSMGRFYRRHVGGEHALLDLAVYAGIGAKLGLSASRSALARGVERARR